MATFTVVGVEPQRVEVEVDVRTGLPTFAIVGLGDRSVREARERVRAAIENAGYVFPNTRVTVNLAPAYLRKTGPGFDLAIACAVLAASQQVDPDRLARMAVVGELSLTGAVRRTRGVLAVAEGAARDRGLDALLVPAEQVGEARLVSDVRVVGLPGLAQLAPALDGRLPVEAAVEVPAERPGPRGHEIDLADVRGHATVLEALTIAAAGGHNLLLEGPPGTGKTMLARRLPTILPAMTPEEALEVTRIRSIVGLPTGGTLAAERPFRAPHHAISVSGLIGGGALPQPGEVTLAHHGVLFLDELSEFPRPTLEALRGPLEDGRVAVVRGQRTAVYPSRCMVVAATNPCPCGHAGDGDRCRCTDADLARHRRRLSGPLLDRIDLRVPVPRPPASALAAPGLRTSAAERDRVGAARERQLLRFAGTGVTSNAAMPAGMVRRHVGLDGPTRRLLGEAHRRGLSARGHERVLRLALTIADLAGEDVGAEHVALALGHRNETVLEVAA